MRNVALVLLTLLAPLGAFSGAQESAPNGVAIERTVKRTAIDWLDRRQEVQRKELLLVRGPNLAILDLTFGERIIIRGDLKKVWKADVLAGEYAEFTFDEAAALRKTALDQLRGARARVPGTPEEKELDRVLEGFDQFAQAPQVELKASGAQRDLIVNGDRVRLSVQVNNNVQAAGWMEALAAAPSVDLRASGAQREVIVNGDRVKASVQVNPQLQAPGWMEALAAVGGFHPAVAEKLKELGGVPVKGTLRYALFLDRIVEQFEVTSAQPREIADAEFELPKGLVRTPLRNFEQAPDRKLTRPPTVNRTFKEDEGDKPKPPAGENKGK